MNNGEVKDFEHYSSGLMQYGNTLTQQSLSSIEQSAQKISLLIALIIKINKFFWGATKAAFLLFQSLAVQFNLYRNSQAVKKWVTPKSQGEKGVVATKKLL